LIERVEHHPFAQFFLAEVAGQGSLDVANRQKSCQDVQSDPVQESACANQPVGILFD
jgi:hypothetical protein